MSYLQILEQDGFDHLESLEDLTEEDLLEMKFKPGHIKSLLKQKKRVF